MNICCVIVTYNIGKEILRTYQSIEKQVNKVIFVDNGSNDATVSVLKEISYNNENCDVIFCKKNEGIARALNIGIKKGISLYNADFILTLDHDSIASENMVKKMMAVYERLKDKENIAILSPAIYDINKKDYLTTVNDKEFQNIKEPIQSGSLIKANIFKEIGFYNEKLFIYYVDTDLCYRLLLANYSLIQCNKAILNHEEGKKTSKKVLGKIVFYNNYGNNAVYYRARNNIYMRKKYKNYFESKDRLLKDFIKILIFDSHKMKKNKYHLLGVIHGLFGIYKK
ncbi:glycosyltransferase [Oceanirhabdus sp. W0125-5]|uniref:glycosyltransferase n=1 Tax=Oceanirhabdus sp. W0125-5 TaxID=2999116 RepID=UPI0022F32DA0|nr:glycosyltransferase [Oceanirhabdus sp. W0125-5]WBW98664.1 glycosyltransferase [Oceanirhabdus sp. W0125-5]